MSMPHFFHPLISEPNAEFLAGIKMWLMTGKLSEFGHEVRFPSLFLRARLMPWTDCYRRSFFERSPGEDMNVMFFFAANLLELMNAYAFFFRHQGWLQRDTSHLFFFFFFFVQALLRAESINQLSSKLMKKSTASAPSLRLFAGQSASITELSL